MQEVKLGDELLEVCVGRGAGEPPHLLHRVERPVRQVKVAVWRRHRGQAEAGECAGIIAIRRGCVPGDEQATVDKYDKLINSINRDKVKTVRRNELDFKNGGVYRFKFKFKIKLIYFESFHTVA